MALSEFRQATHSIDHVPDLPFSLHQERRPGLTQLPRIVIRWSYCHRGIDIQVTVIYRYRVNVMDVGQQIGNIIVELEGDKSLIGTFQNVKITRARNWILKGELS